MKPSLIVHGGAWAIPDDALEACRRGIRHALDAGWPVLEKGGSAMDAIEAAIHVLEEDPVFDAGVGSHLTLEGKVELDAIVMDGATLNAGAVASVHRVRNPIHLARSVMEKSGHVLLTGDGAEQFAVEQGIALCDPRELIVPREQAAWAQCREGKHQATNHAHHAGTVGAVALDSNGHIAAGTSTGGTCCKRAGRVGDSPLIGCGCYADDEAGGVSCTGHGEAIMKIVMAKAAVDMMRPALASFVGPDSPPLAAALAQDAGTPQRVAEECIQLLAKRTHSTAGLILLDRNGMPGVAFNTAKMAWGRVLPDGSFFVNA
jgi:L-asparaginase / beta-aspartyl-peptidase